MSEPDQVNSPDALLSDPDSKVFYLLRNEELAICSTLKELPHWQNRTSYLSCGRFSPKFKKVVFYPDPVNPGRAMKLLVDNCHIGADYTYAVAGGGTRTPKSKVKEPPKVVNRVRERQVENLIRGGMRRQGGDNSEETTEPETSTE